MKRKLNNKTATKPAIIGIKVRRINATGVTPTAPAMAIVALATGEIDRMIPQDNCMGLTKEAALPPKPEATSGANAAKLEKAPTPEPVNKLTIPTTPVKTTVVSDHIKVSQIQTI